MNDDDSQASARAEIPPQAVETRVLEIVNKKGLHARASAKFCHTVEQFDADVRVSRGQDTVGGTSIMGLMMLGAGIGSKITIQTSGNDAVAVADALEQLVTSGFYEED
jgi:phosphocarrier protein HPr